MNILSIVPKTAALLEALHVLKHPGHDDQSVHGGGGGGGTASELNAARASEAKDTAQNLEVSRMDTQMALEDARESLDEMDAEVFDDMLDDAEDMLSDAQGFADGAAESYEAGDITGGDALMRDATDAIVEATNLMNVVRGEVGLPDIKQ